MSKIYNVQTFVSAPIMSGASIDSSTIPITSVVGTAVALSGTQSITGAKTFSSLAIAVAGAFSVGDSSTVDLGTNGSVTVDTGTTLSMLSGSTFELQSSVTANMGSNVLTSVGTPAQPTDAANKTYVDSNFVALTGAQTVAGIKTFSSAPVMSGASITSGTIPIASVVGTAMDLTTSQTAGGTKTFSTGISTAAFRLSTSPSSGYVLTSDGSGNGTWAVAGGSGLFTWSTVTGTSQAMLANNGYIANNASQITFTLPSTASVGDAFRISGLGAGGYKIAQNASQLIRFGSSVTTTGTGGSLTTTNQYDSIQIICIVTNTTFTVVDSVSAGFTVV